MATPARRTKVEQLLRDHLARQLVPAASDAVPLLTVTRVELAADLKDGTVWVTAGESVSEEQVITEVTRLLPSVRSAVRSQLDLRYYPNLTVRYDRGQEASLQIERLLSEGE